MTECTLCSSINTPLLRHIVTIHWKLTHCSHELEPRNLSSSERSGQWNRFFFVTFPWSTVVWHPQCGLQKMNKKPQLNIHFLLPSQEYIFAAESTPLFWVVTGEDIRWPFPSLHSLTCSQSLAVWRRPEVCGWRIHTIFMHWLTEKHLRARARTSSSLCLPTSLRRRHEAE